LAEQAAALPSVEQAAWDEAEAQRAALAVLPRVAEHEASALPQAAEHAGVQQQGVGAAGPVAAEEAAEAALRAVEVVAVQRLAAPGAPVALPWGVAWAFHRDQPPPWPAP
jgi:hypothetical protein